MDESNKLSSQRKQMDGTTEIKPNDEMTMQSTTEKPAGTGEELKIPVIEKAQTSKTKLKPVVLSGLVE